jgi:hypothetical protein
MGTRNEVNLLTTADLVIIAHAWRARNHAATNLLRLVTKLGLDGGIVNVISMKYSSNIMDSLHVVCTLIQTNVNRCDVLGFGELPDV